MPVCMLSRSVVFVVLETVSDITRILLDMPSIEYVGEIQTQWVGPSTFAFKAEVDFDGTYLAANLHPRCVLQCPAVACVRV